MSAEPLLSDHADAPDPFDLDSLRQNPFNGDIAVKKVLITVPLRKPGRHDFIRVNPDPDYILDAPIIEHTSEGSLNKQVYWVDPRMRDDLAAELKPVRLFTCVTKRNVLFLWPAKLPGVTDAGRRWSESALEVAETAKDNWVRMSGNVDLGAYELTVAQGDLGKPDWPDKPFGELIRIAFKGYIIDSPDHPVLLELDGRA